MNRQDNIKKMYEQAKLDTIAEKDKAVLEKMKEIYLQESKAETKPAELSVWRIIMKSKISKLAAAALIIIAALLLLHNGSVSITTPAFGLEDVYNAIDQIKWVHCKMTIVQMSGDTETVDKTIGDGWESWGSTNPYISVEKHTNGFIVFKETTEKGIKKSVYNPKSSEPNSIIITYEQPDSQQSNSSYKDMLKVELSRLEKEGTKIEYKNGTFEGRPVTIITVDYIPKDGKGYHSIMSLLVDADTYLPKKMEWQQIALKNNLTGKTIGIFDYPLSGPTDIYQAGAPRDAKIIEETQENK